MIGGFIILSLLAALVGAYFVLIHRHKSKYLAFAEYWVYLPGDKMPPQDDIMALMIQTNPYSRRGVSPIGPQEGLVFSDVRLHVALVMRSKNPHIFRPDLFDETIKPPAALIEALKEAQSLVKLRYVSEIPLKDKRHLQFLMHASDAVAELGGSRVIYDVKAEKVIARGEFAQLLKENFDATVSALHTSVVWKSTVQGGFAETHGLSKIGISDLRTFELEQDQRVIATTVLSEAVRRIWDLGSLPESLDVTTFDDTFKIQIEKVKDAMASVRILRVQTI